MATNKLVNKWADDIARNLEDVGFEKYNVSAVDAASADAYGRIIVGIGRYKVTMSILDNEYLVSVRVFGKMNKAHRRRAAQRTLEAMGYKVKRDGDAVVTNIEVNRIGVARLAEALAA